MFVACSTRCFSREPLEKALRHIADLEFGKIEVALDWNGPHLQPDKLISDFDGCFHRIRYATNQPFSSLAVDFGAIEGDPFQRQFEASCRLAKALTVAVMTIPAAPAGTPLDREIARLAALTEYANRAGLVLTVLTDSRTITADPEITERLCREVPGLGLTLDPSHYIQLSATAFDDLFPYVQNVQLRDTGKKPDEFHVRIGQGKVEYNRLVTMLERNGYNRSLTVAIFDDPEPPFDVEVEVRKLKLVLESLL